MEGGGRGGGWWSEGWGWSWEGIARIVEDEEKCCNRLDSKKIWLKVSL